MKQKFSIGDDVYCDRYWGNWGQKISVKGKIIDCIAYLTSSTYEYIILGENKRTYRVSEANLTDMNKEDYLVHYG